MLGIPITNDFVFDMGFAYMSYLLTDQCLFCRNTEFYGDERLGSTVNGSMGHAPAAGSYDDSLESRREVLKQENPETVQENQYTFAQSETEYAKQQQQQQLNTAYDASQTNAQNQMQNLASLSNVMVSYMCIIHI